MFFYRTHDGAEADVVIAKAGRPEILIEIKYSTTPKLSKGFYIAGQDMGIQRYYVVCPVESGFPLSENTHVLSYRALSSIFQ
jgi:hypothetical protein